MGLVDYSESESEDEHVQAVPPSKKRRISKDENASLPPLPASFLDQYSSTVRTSTRDDPSLHGGRTRVTPHVEGNWPTHVYLEWYPGPEEHELLSRLISNPNDIGKKDSSQNAAEQEVHSLLQNGLGVSLPLHISLSRPLVLKTPQKDSCFTRLTKNINEHGIKSLTLIPKDLAWHSNEAGTRWFLVVRLQNSPELWKLLGLCNDVAKEFDQPLLYANGQKGYGKQKGDGKKEGDGDVEVDEFHISIAWSLRPPDPNQLRGEGTSQVLAAGNDVGVPYELVERLAKLEIAFGEVKVRIGQDVHGIPLKARRR